MIYSVVVSDHEEGAPLEKDCLVCSNGRAELLKAFFELFDVRKQDADDLGPRFVESFVPDAGLEHFSSMVEVLPSQLKYSIAFLLEYHFALSLLE